MVWSLSTMHAVQLREGFASFQGGHGSFLHQQKIEVTVAYEAPGRAVMSAEMILSLF